MLGDAVSLHIAWKSLGSHIDEGVNNAKESNSDYRGVWRDWTGPGEERGGTTGNFRS